MATRDIAHNTGKASPDNSLEEEQRLNGGDVTPPGTDEEEEESNELEDELNECFDIALEECDEEESQLVHQLEDISLQDMPPPVAADEDDDEESEEVGFCLKI